MFNNLNIYMLLSDYMLLYQNQSQSWKGFGFYLSTTGTTDKILQLSAK